MGASTTNQVHTSITAGKRRNTEAYAASLVVKTASGALLSLTGYNSKATAQFVQIHESSTLTADGTFPILTFTVPGTSNFSIDFGLPGLPCNGGIVVCNSSTGPTKTIGSADCYFTAVYR